MGHAGPIALGNEAKRLADYGNRIEQIRAVNDWQPADAAPKDGTEIILANVHKRHQWIDEWVIDKDDDRGGYWMMCDQWGRAGNANAF